MDWTPYRAAGAPRLSIRFRAHITRRIVVVSAGRAGERARAVLAWARSLRIPPGRVAIWCAPGSVMGAAWLLARTGVVPPDCADAIVIGALIGHGLLAWFLAADTEARLRAQQQWRDGGGTVIAGAAQAEALRLALVEERLAAAEERLRAYDTAWAALAPAPARQARHLALAPQVLD